MHAPATYNSDDMKDSCCQELACIQSTPSHSMQTVKQYFNAIVGREDISTKPKWDLTTHTTPLTHSGIARLSGTWRWVIKMATHNRNYNFKS
jgi:hypothetical protein